MLEYRNVLLWICCLNVVPLLLTDWSIAGLKWEKLSSLWIYILLVLGPIDFWASCKKCEGFLHSKLSKCFSLAVRDSEVTGVNADASKTGISEPHWWSQMFILMCERWLERNYKLVYALFNLKREMLLIVWRWWQLIYNSILQTGDVSLRAAFLCS